MSVISRARYLYKSGMDALETRRKGRFRFAARELLGEVASDAEAGYLVLALIDMLGPFRGAWYLVALEKIAAEPLLTRCRLRCSLLAALASA